MDGMAKWLAKNPFQGPNQYNIPHKGWCCYIVGQWTIIQLLTEMHNHINRITITKHWATKQCYWQGTICMVDWDTADQAMLAVAQGQQRWVTKLAAWFLPYGVNMKQWKLCTCNNCPRCQRPGKTKTHIFKCKQKNQKSTGLDGLAKPWQLATSTKHKP